MDVLLNHIAVYTFYLSKTLINIYSLYYFLICKIYDPQFITEKISKVIIGILQVTFVEALDQLMPGFDPEISKLAQRVLINPRNIDYHTGVFATKVTTYCNILYSFVWLL